MGDAKGSEDEGGATKRRKLVNRPLVLLDVRLPDGLQARLEKDFEVLLISEVAAWNQRCAEVRAVFSYQHIPIDAALLSKFPNLAVVSNFGAGYDHIECKACLSRGVPLGNTPGVVADATADIAIALALAGSRNLVAGHLRYREEPKFDPNWWGESFTGATLGIVGLGNIGKKLAQRAKAFQTETVYWGRRRAPVAVENALSVQYCSELCELLGKSDIVVLCVAVTPETTRLIGVTELQAMKRTALLVNVARGKVVDTDALVQALQDGTIAKAALDVTDPEPLPPGHPLFGMENVVLSPHLGTAEAGTRNRMMTMALANLRAGLAGSPLPHPVPECASVGPSGGAPEAEGQRMAVSKKRLSLVVGNKAYSSWSLRAWLACRIACGSDGFEEKVVPLAGAGSDSQREVLLQYSPTGKVPALTDGEAADGGLTIWDSLAICEYVAELYPEAGLWPADPRARALARAAASEMHSGFARLRAELPMNCRRPPVEAAPGAHDALARPGVTQDVARICELWETLLACPWRGRGAFLLGPFGVVDAMFAPVVLRFATYNPRLTSLAAEKYCATMLSVPELQEWIEGARKEGWHIDHYENL